MQEDVAMPEGDFSCLLTQREQEYLAQLEKTCIFLEMKTPDLTSEYITEIMRQYGCVKVIKESLTGFWCNFTEIDNDQTI